MSNKYQLTLAELKNRNQNYLASIFSTGNGHFGVRASNPILNDPDSGTIVNGYFETAPIIYGESAYGYAKNHQSIVLLPDIRHLIISYRGQKMHKSIVRDMRLDMKKGKLFSTYLVRDDSGNELLLEVTSTVDQNDLHLFLIQYQLTAQNFQGLISVQKPVKFKRSNQEAFDPRKGKQVKQLITTKIYQQDNIEINRFNTANSKQSIDFGQRILTPYHTLDLNNLRLETGKPVTIRYVVGISDINLPLNVNTLANSTAYSVEKSAENYWKQFWNSSDIVIDGQPRLEAGLSYNLFQLNQAAGRDGNTNISSKGVSGIGYEGHYFWDTEMYMLPFFIFTQPAEAKKLLSYRYSILPKAKERARQLGIRRGALFAWRTIDGEEASAYFPASTAQYHINADIAYAVALYYQVTHDIAFIRDKGWPIVLETARFWKEFGNWQLINGKKQFGFFDVTGPDEYTAIVNNNYYTNRMAQYNLSLAVYFAELIKENAPEHLQDLSISHDELKTFRTISDHIYLPYSQKYQIIAQDDSFLNKPIWPFSDTPKDKYPLLLHFHPLTIYRYQVTKQADGLLADMLFPNDYNVEQKRRNYDYYEAITTHDSSLSRSIFSILAARIGLQQKAEDYFMTAALTDLTDLQGNSEDGLHMANMGGSWLCLIYGFAGVQLSATGISITNHLPKSWQGLQFKITYHARQLFIKLSHDQDTVTRLSGAPLAITLNGKHIMI